MDETTRDLSSFDDDSQKIIDGIDAILNYIGKYGDLVPGMGPHTHSLNEVRRNVSGALTLRGK